jgi:hypothetical protein
MELVCGDGTLGRIPAAVLPFVGAELEYRGFRYRVAAVRFRGDARGLSAVVALADPVELPTDGPGVLFV